MCKHSEAISRMEKPAQLSKYPLVDDSIRSDEIEDRYVEQALKGQTKHKTSKNVNEKLIFQPILMFLMYFRGEPIHSSMYKNLKTNLPKEIIIRLWIRMVRSYLVN